MILQIKQKLRAGKIKCWSQIIKYTYLYAFNLYNQVVFFSAALKSMHISFPILLRLLCSQPILVIFMRNKPEERNNEGQLMGHLLFQYSMSKWTVLPWCFFSRSSWICGRGQKECFHWWNSGTACHVVHSTINYY